MAFLRNAWYVAATSDEVTRTPLPRLLLGEPWVLYRRLDGTAVALGDTCPHRLAPLHRGRLVGDTLQCPYHGLRFDADGRCRHNPQGSTLPTKCRVPAPVVAERQGLVWVWMGDAEQADPAKVLDVEAMMTGRPFETVHGRLLVQAHYQLVMDNLLDLSHVAYLHPFLSGVMDGDSSFGGTATHRAEMAQAGDTVVARHWSENLPVSPFFQALWPGHPERGTVRGHMHWHAPSSLCFDNGITSVDGSAGVATPSVHLLTPATATSTHYFWRLARDTHIGNASVSQAIAAGVQHAFQHEDEPMIQALQARMGDADLMHLDPTLLPGDAAAMRARRVLQALIEDEARAAQAAGR